MSEQKKFEPTITRGYSSRRGPFKINENPAITTPIPASKIKDEHAAAAFDYSALAEKYGEEETRDKVVEMVKAFTEGTSSTLLFAQRAATGMTLAHVWFWCKFSTFSSQPSPVRRLSVLRYYRRDHAG